MNVYDLDEKATAAPWYVYGACQTNDGWITTGEYYLAEFPGEGLPSPSLVVCDANMRLAVHCRNNFFKALAALKEAEGYIAGDQGETDEQVMKLRKLIEELEEVPQ